jgi:hypothetical protein
LGFRISTVMLRIGVKEDALESFVLDVYNRCQDIGILPENIYSCLHPTGVAAQGKWCIY